MILINSIGGFCVGDTAICGGLSVKVIVLHQNGDAEVQEPDGQTALTRVEFLSKPKKDLSSLLIETGDRPSKSLSALLGD